MRFLTSVSSVLVISLLAACSSDTTKPPVRRDGGVRDSGEDANLPDATVPDVDGRVPDFDGSFGRDSGGPEIFDAGPPPEGCHAGPVDVIALGEDTTRRQRTPHVAANNRGWGIVWSQLYGLSEEIVLGRLAIEGGFAMISQITNDTAISRDPSIISIGDDFEVAWFDNSKGNFEAFAEHVTGMDGPLSAPQQLTMNTLRDDSVSIAPLGSGAVVAWAESNDLAMIPTRQLKSRITDPTGMGTSTAVALSGTMDAASAFNLHAWPTGAMMSFVDTRPDSFRVALQALDASGALSGGPQIITTDSFISGSVDAATDGTGGAVVYGVNVAGGRPEVRFRPVDASGAPTAPERVITPAPERAADASIARISTGWVVAYRALSDDGLSGPKLRAAFLDAVGNLVQRVDLTDIEPGGGRTSVAVTPDAHVLVVWSDLTALGIRVRAARVTCD